MFLKVNFMTCNVFWTNTRNETIYFSEIRTTTSQNHILSYFTLLCLVSSVDRNKWVQSGSAAEALSQHPAMFTLGRIFTYKEFFYRFTFFYLVISYF